jgi:hypothetical protein
MSALSGSLQNKMDWLHNAVIIAKDELLVKRKPQNLGLEKS